MEKNGIEGLEETVPFFDSARRGTVLIIDDTPMVISMVSRMLFPLYSVKAAKNGADGVRIAREQKIDLIFLDIKMPGADGFEVLDELKRGETRDIPVVILSGAAEPENLKRGFALGAAEFVEKPFVEEEMLRIVEKIVGGRDQ